jgi:hypothetical protein
MSGPKYDFVRQGTCVKSNFAGDMAVQPAAVETRAHNNGIAARKESVVNFLSRIKFFSVHKNTYACIK